MRKSPLLLYSLLALALLLSACASPQATPAAAQPTSAPPPTEAPSMPEATEAATAEVPVTGGGTTVAMTASAAFGPILVDDKGMTLYMFEKDTPSTSSCYGGCAANWPPLLATGDPVAGEGVDAALLGVTERTDGSMQVTYNGWPLYYYVKDAQAGDLAGQGVGDVWFVLAPDGSVLKEAPAAPASSSMPAEPY